MGSKKEVQNVSFVRPPVVAVLGHVDHGKTSLLDYIRKSHLAEREAGGITQAIGAYQIEVKDKKITFIDTPGHAAFSKMRQRGGQAADIVILVVAADDGVMPQTLESVEHIKAANVPFIVAINKVDLPTADPEKVKNQLSQNGVYVEGYGGKVVALPVSAKTGQGIAELLEMVLLVAEMEELKGDPEGILKGIVIESKKDKAGPAGTVVVKNGCLKIGDLLLAGGVTGKVRGLLDENGKRQEKVEPGGAAEVLGFESPPPVGAEVVKVETIVKKEPLFQAAKIPQFTEEEEKKLKVILKADTFGSLEALSNILPADVVLVSAGVGDLTESEVFLGQMTKAQIYGFRIKVPAGVAKLAESERVVIKTNGIIYQILDDLEKESLACQFKTQERTVGRMEILAEFQIEGSRIAGGRVSEGKISRGDHLKLERQGKALGEAEIISLKQRARAISEAKAGEECGILLDPPLDFKVGDVLISVRPVGNA